MISATASAATKDPTANEATSEQITITGNDRLQFEPAEFTVAPGTEVTVVFKNIGRMPKEMMGHNLVILDKSIDPMEFARASLPHAANAYVAPDYEESVVAFTQVIGPRESETITFTAPDAPGDYFYVCSFPGHTPGGMYGIMKVE